MEFVHAAKAQGLPKIMSIQNSYSLLVRCRFEGEKIASVHSFHSLQLSYTLISDIVEELLKILFDFWYNLKGQSPLDKQILSCQ